MSTLTREKPCSLMRRTREMLRLDERPLLDIHKQSKIPFYWLKKFRSGEIREPSVNRVQRLFEFLSNGKLSV